MTILIVTLSSVQPVLASPLTAPAQTQAAIYPDPPPDFSHPGSPHYPLYSPYGGALDRPLLVIYLHFSDQPEPPGKDLEWARQMFFGPEFPNVVGWYQANSFGKLTLFPASETQGVVNDGVVIVDGGAIEEYNALYPDEGAMNRRLLELVDEQHSVDFSVFDSNGDDIITDEELILVNLRVHTDDSGNAGQRFLCDGTPPPCPTVTMNGMTIAVSVAMGLHGTNFLTWVHETAHIAVQQTDLYDYGVGSLAIGGPTPDASFSANAWEKMHWGWATPTVVVKDGFYTVDQAYTTGESFILYDPDKGTNDYFMVENRQQLAGTYDKDATDDGLVIWRIDEAKFNSTSARPIEIMRADGATNPGCNPYCYGGSNGDAWNPADPATPQRTMSRTWRDGTASNVAVRAIGASGNTVRAYFDVRGPGVLVDAYPVDLYGPPKVVAGALQTIAVPVMNTGEAVDTFEFSFTGLPAGWTAVPRSVTLAPGVETMLLLDFTPAHDHPEGIVTVSVTGTSLSDPSVTSTDSMDVQVVHISDLAILGVQADGAQDEMLFGDAHSITVSTKVTNNGPSWPTDATVTVTTVASAGGQVTPASWTQNLLALAKGEVRELSNTFQVSCQGPGKQSFTFVVEIKPTLATETDLVGTNNTGQVTFDTDCVVPVAINIKPGGFPNAINLNGTAPVAVLTTRAGEYGLPFDFDATKIDPLSVLFGPASLVFSETGGATAFHGTGHLEDATELDEMTLDGDLDMVLQFRVADSGLTPASTEACVKGTFTGADGAVYKFFGCDSVKVSPSP